MMNFERLEIVNDSGNYSTMSRIFTWVNSDMDGAVSTILLGNIFPNMEFRHCFFGALQEQYLEWEKHYLDEYDKVFIVGMVIDQQLVNKIDDRKVVFISDRGDKLQTYDSTLITEECSSCCKLIYKKFKQKIDFSLELKKLVLYADDYNSYDLKYSESEYLNAVYRSIRANRFNIFVERFWNGYDGFTDEELEKASRFFDELENACRELEIFQGIYNGWRVLATFSKFSVNEIAKKLIDNHSADVIIVINPDTKFVSFRKPSGSEANIAQMAEELCDGGGGEWAAGGSLSPKFIEFSTSLELL